MKKVITILILIISLSGYSQEKWRTFTIGTTSNVNNEIGLVQQVRASLDYELSNNYAISSWNGYSYTQQNESSWFASQTTIDKRFGGFTVGAGYLYTENVSQQVIAIKSSDLFFTVKLQYRVKL